MIHSDQASLLRKTFHKNTSEQNISGVRSISITSGKGGVGKTNTVINLAIQLAKLEKKVFLMDADLGLANIDIILNLPAKYTIEDVLLGKRNINDVLLKGPYQIDILPASSGLAEMSELTKTQQMAMLQELGKLKTQYDYFLIDTGAGISSNVLRFNASADEILVITTPEPTSITDAYALMKVMSTKYQIRQFSLLINQSSLDEAKSVYERLVGVSKKFLSFDLIFAGYIPYDKKVIEAVKHRTPMSLLSPNHTISLAYKNLATHLNSYPGISLHSHFEKPLSFWERIANWKKNF